MMSYEAAIQATTFLSLGLFLYVGALQVLDGDLTIGELVSFNALMLLANAPIAVMLFLWDQLQYTSVLLSRLNDILEQEPPEQGAHHSLLRPVPTRRAALHSRASASTIPDRSRCRSSAT